MVPMTPEEAAQVVANTEASAVRHGVWDKICNTCDRSVGGRLAEYGRPTEADLKYLACPFCWHAATKGFRVEFVAGDE
jgi:hypothetical protein